jgi:nucleotide-binding universal stress UspA family protein
MSDTIAFSPTHARSAVFADGLARRLDLRMKPFPAPDPPGAALAVAPAREHRHRAPPVPVLILTRSAESRVALPGRTVVCGVRDELDAPAAATAAAVAGALGLAFVLVHVLGLGREILSASMAPPAMLSVTPEDVVWADGMLARVLDAAGVHDLDVADRRVECGIPGPALVALACAQDVALVVVSASDRPWPLRAVIPSVTEHLVRRSDRPVLVCPRDPAAAMRVREALAHPFRRARDGA